MMVMSYNPGYQNITKELKESTKQRFSAMTFDYPDIPTETKILIEEAGIAEDTATKLAEMASKIRNLKGFGLNEGVSTRLLVYAGKLNADGLTPNTACRAAIGEVLTDDEDVATTILDIIDLFFPADQLEPETVTN